MAVLELSISTSYVPKWGVWEAVREILQNGLDADDNGQKLTWKYCRGKLTISNKGARLSRRTLLLGETSKMGDVNSRGQFGEGYKLALLAFCRLGKQVRIVNDDESWTPNISRSASFDGASVLVVTTRQLKTPTGALTYEVSDISQDDWEQIQDNCLAMSQPKADDVIETEVGRVLTGPLHQGRLFVGGLFVCRMDGAYRWGYDLPAVDLDRDRKMASPWSLQWEVAKALNAAVQADQISIADIRPHSEEMRAFAQNLHYVESSARKEADRFEQTHGTNAVPVADAAMAETLKNQGMVPVMTTVEHAAFIASVRGRPQDRIDRRALDAQRLWQIDELEESELAVLRWARLLVEEVYSFEQPVQVVTFFGEKVKGTFASNCIRLSRDVLADRADCIATLVHEVAHNEGSDGSMEHERSMESIFARIIAKRVVAD